MSEIDITYKGSSIATMDASGTKTLLTSGKYCEDDIEITYTRPSGGGGTVIVTDTTDSHGGTIREITAIEINNQDKTVTPSTSQQTITADTGYSGLGTVTVNAMPSGTAGTPTATKGAVSNHSISVTPSVTNTTGYITGSTKTGTAVTVSASELVSGTKSITANGTGIDVSNYANVDVAVSGGTSKNVQLVQNNSTRITATAYTKACGTITVSKAGTYDIYWCAYRTSSSGTWGTQWYKNGEAQGSAQTTFTNSYYQAIHLTNITLAKNDEIDVYGRSRGSNYYLYVGQITIIEV